MEESRPGYYAIIPADVRYDDQIPANAKLLYGEISALIGAEGYCYASNQFFAKNYKWTVEAVSRMIAKLEKAGHIKREYVRDTSGQIVQRKLYLSVSVPRGLPLDQIINTPQPKNQGGIDQKVKETNTSITDIEKENIKEKDERPAVRRMPLTDEQLRDSFRSWIAAIADDWTRDDKNALYFALDGFYAPRATKKQEPARSKAAFTALCNRLTRYSKGCPGVMIDMLERATTSGWKSVFPLGSDSRRQQEQPGRGGEDEIWL